MYLFRRNPYEHFLWILVKLLLRRCNRSVYCLLALVHVLGFLLVPDEGQLLMHEMHQ